MPEQPPKPKPLYWSGSSRKDFGSFAAPVQDEMGYALYLAQIGKKHERAKPLKGFGGAGVLEAMIAHDGDEAQHHWKSLEQNR